MVPMPFSESDQKTMLQVARASLQQGLQCGSALKVRPADYTEPLRLHLACFVTLERRGQLRGCIGHLEALQPLICDVAENAFAAGFLDPRFPAIGGHEWFDLELHISILSPPESLTFDSETDLIAQIRPGVDGLILEDGIHRGTFLPSVWRQLPEPEQFWWHLKRKAGLPMDHWSNSLKLSRYTSFAFGSPIAELD